MENTESASTYIDTEEKLVLTFDTANETIAVAVGRLDVARREVSAIACVQEKAHRASNTRLLPIVDELFAKNGLSRDAVACVCVGAGPGSFTGVRIAMSTAKGVSSALGVPLVAVSTLNAIAYGAWAAGSRGNLLVVGDAMRKEVYPACFALDDGGVRRLTPDRVVKAAEFEMERQVFAGTAAACAVEGKVATGAGAAGGAVGANEGAGATLVAGDAMRRHGEAVAEAVRSAGLSPEVLPEGLWEPTGEGLLLELARVWRSGDDILDGAAHDPMVALPVYTRLSDAEENERARLADSPPRDLRTGVQGSDVRCGIAFAPFDAAYSNDAASIESAVMGTDAWSASSIADDLACEGRSWWMALDGEELVGYAGGLVAGDDVQLLKVAVRSSHRRRGIAAELISRLAEDCRNLAVASMSLEVRVSNDGARAFYERMGFAEEGVRPRYYSDGEDALIMSCAIPALAAPGLAGLKVVEGAESGSCAGEACEAEASAAVLQQASQPLKPADVARPLILAIESSCDETAAAVVDGDSRVLSDVVASQIDFHARFGGVVPEIASRKHVEAIAGVTRMALEDAPTPLEWRDLDAVAVTYAPGLVGALVVGVAFAKGAAWALDIPLIGVNHLEGHLYANKLSRGFEPPAVVSLVSGGNTMLVHMRGWQDYEILGATIDDAVGEAFDKVAKTLGLPYPGGPHISRLAAEGNPAAIDFPRALMHSGDYRFSLSGLKTAVMVYVQKVRDAGEELNLADVCASFQQAVVDVQVQKARRALRETGARCLCIGGGVAANPVLRSSYEAMCAEEGATLLMPPLSACGDNAAMIGLVAQDRFEAGAFMGLDGDALAHADLSKPY